MLLTFVPPERFKPGRTHGGFPLMGFRGWGKDDGVDTGLALVIAIGIAILLLALLAAH